MTLSPSRTSLAVCALCGLISTGCGAHIAQLYEQTRSEVLAEPPPAGSDWPAQVVLGLAWPLVDGLLADAVDARLKDVNKGVEVALPLGASARLWPELEVTDTTTGAGDCDTCIRVDCTLSGHLRWKAGALEDALPIETRAVVVATLESRAGDDGTDIIAVLKSVDLRGSRSATISRVKVNLDDPIARWAQKTFQQDPPQVLIAELDSTEVPLRAVRIRPAKASLQVELLTTSGQGGPVAAPSLASRDWAVAISQATLLDLARRASFQQGPQAYDVVAEPRGLSLNNDTFTLDLRVWRLTGSGWWRDYQVAGTSALSDKKIKLKPSGVVEQEHSKGAGIVDPLALLARGQILSAIEQAAQVAQPRQLRQKLGNDVLEMTVDLMQGTDDTLLLAGSAAVTARSRARQEPGDKSRDGGSKNASDANGGSKKKH